MADKVYIGYSLGTMKICPICGKEFLMKDAAEWAYKRPRPREYGNVTHFCSWRCLRQYDATERERRIQMLEKQREAREKKKKAKMKGGVKPIEEVKAHYTIHRCGKCGKQVAMTSKTCKYCNTKIDWSMYEPEKGD